MTPRAQGRDGIVFDIKRYAIHDGPGIRTTVFLKGCPLRCGWCHNPESQRSAPELLVRESRCRRCGICVRACRQGALALVDGGLRIDRARCTQCGACTEVCPPQALEMVGARRTVSDVMGEIVRDRPFYEESGGGATFSGGEPLWQADFLGGLLRACKEQGISTVVDTCGFAPWETIERVRGDVDLFLYDLKLMRPDQHVELTGVPSGLVHENLERLSSLGQRVVVRVAVIPGVNDTDDELASLGQFVASLPRPVPIDLLPYHRAGIGKYARLGRLYSLGEVAPPDAGQMARVVRALETFDIPITVGGESRGDD